MLIVPASLFSNWENEILQFSPNLKYYIAHPGYIKTEYKKNGDIKTENTQTSQQKPDLAGVNLVITTYAMAQRHKWMEKTQWRCLILDEAQAIKNPAPPPKPMPPMQKQSTQKPIKKPIKKAGKQERSPYETVVGIISKRTVTPIDFKEIKERTGLEDTLIRNILARAKQKGAITNKDRGFSRTLPSSVVLESTFVIPGTLIFRRERIFWKVFSWWLCKYWITNDKFSPSRDNCSAYPASCSGRALLI